MNPTDLTEWKLSEISKLQSRTFFCHFPYWPSFADQGGSRDVLVVSFYGEYGDGCDGGEDATFMVAITAGAIAALPRFALILDLREMAYVWGDKLTEVLYSGESRFEAAELPTAVVVSDRCRAGMTSLVRAEMSEDASQWLYDSLQAPLLPSPASKESGSRVRK
jgi:hypothetical protein